MSSSLHVTHCPLVLTLAIAGLVWAAQGGYLECHSSLPGASLCEPERAGGGLGAAAGGGEGDSLLTWGTGDGGELLCGGAAGTGL